MLVYIHMYMSTCAFINDTSKTLSKSVNNLKGAVKITANGINSLKNIWSLRSQAPELQLPSSNHGG